MKATLEAAYADSDTKPDGSAKACAVKPVNKKVYGTLKMIRLQLLNTYNVCSDEVGDAADYKRFYILEDAGVYGYHWLAQRKNADDTGKPSALPVTLHSRETLRCKIWFKVEGPPLEAAPAIRLTNAAGYKFPEASGQASGEFSLEFTASNKPFDGIIRHFNTFSLVGEYSTDGKKTWKGAGQSSNELYLTWKAFELPRYFDNRSSPNMLIKSSKTGGKFYIPETILSLGCKGADNRGNVKNFVGDASMTAAQKAEADILDHIFVAFAGLNVHRRRAAAGPAMGYWRGVSSFMGNPMPYRGLRALLKLNEARCGEWTSFLNHIAIAQGIVNMGDVPILLSKTPAFPGKNFAKDKTDVLHPAAFFVKACVLQKVADGIPRVYKYKPTSVICDTYKTSGASPAQGNPQAVNSFTDHVFSKHIGSGRFFDASYGAGKAKFRDKAASTIPNYCQQMLDGILNIKPGYKYSVSFTERSHYLYAIMAELHDVRKDAAAYAKSLETF